MEQIELLPEDYDKYDLSFKIVLMGDSETGKSSLYEKAIKNIFEDTYKETTGFEFLFSFIKIEGKVIKLQIMDISGREENQDLFSFMYKQFCLAIIVYSIDNKKSFINAKKWIDKIKSGAPPYIKFILVGNKCDLQNSR